MVEDVIIRPTVILRMGEGEYAVVTAGEGEKKALMVFRGPEDAARFRETTGKGTAAEGFQLIGMQHEAIEKLLEQLKVSLVVMPEPWTGEGLVDTFEAENFLTLLRESPEE